MRQQLLFASLAALLLGGCDSIPGTTAYKIAEAEKAIAADLNDPSSARFRNVYVTTSGAETVCGEINGKNGYGAYSGFRRFSYSVERRNGQISYDYDPKHPMTQDVEQQELLSENQRLFELGWNMTCGLNRK